MEKKAIPTPATFSEVMDAISAAWAVVMGERPTVACQIVLCAHSSFETGGWHSMMNYNIGNAKAAPGQGRDYTYFPTKEYLPVSVANSIVSKSTDEQPCKLVATLGGTAIVQFYPKHPTCCFRAFDSLPDGMVDHMKLLAGRYRAAFAFADKADVAGYVRSIRSNGYFTGPLVDYIGGMNRAFDKFAQIQLGVSDLKTWQAENGLVPDGVIGPLTRGKLQECLQKL